MIFSVKNEYDVPLWELVMSGDKTLTRRKRPEPVGSLRAIQPGRTKKGIGYIKIISCVHEKKAGDSVKDLTVEAVREGFLKWSTITDYLNGTYGNDNDIYRIEFVKICRCGETPDFRDDGTTWCKCGRGVIEDS